MPGKPIKKPASAQNIPSLKNMKRILDASARNDNLGLPGTASSYTRPVMGSREDMQAKGLVSTATTAAEDNSRASTYKPGTAVSKGYGKKVDFGAAGDFVGTYGSNVINSFRKPPLPPVPEGISPVTLKRVNLDNSRNEIARQGRTADLVATNSGLDTNAATAVRATNLATRLNAVNGVNAQEASMNSDIANREAQMNLGVEGANVAGRNQHANDVVSMKLATQREQSENQANAANKFIGIKNEQAKAQLEMDKYKVGQQLFRDSGVFDRFLAREKAQGNDDPTGIIKQYKTRNGYRTGGMLRKVFNYS